MPLAAEEPGEQPPVPQSPIWSGGTRQADPQRGGPAQAGPPDVPGTVAPVDGVHGITVWERTARSLLALGADLDPDGWERLTGCPGWPVTDQFGYILGAGRFLPGEAPHDAPRTTGTPSVTSRHARPAPASCCPRSGRG